MASIELTQQVIEKIKASIIAGLGVVKSETLASVIEVEIKNGGLTAISEIAFEALKNRGELASLPREILDAVVTIRGRGERGFISIATMAKEMNCNKRTILNMVEDGSLPPFLGATKYNHARLKGWDINFYRHWFIEQAKLSVLKSSRLGQRDGRADGSGGSYGIDSL